MRRIIVKDEKEKTLLEISMTVGVTCIVFAPSLGGHVVAALAADDSCQKKRMTYSTLAISKTKPRATRMMLRKLKSPVKPSSASELDTV